MKRTKRASTKRAIRAKPPVNCAARFEQLLADASVFTHYSLKLFVTGTTTRSTQAVASIRALCDEFLPGRYDLEVVDIYQQPTAVTNQQIIAAPTLIKALPEPPKRMIGNLSDRNKLIAALGLDPSAKGNEAQEPSHDGQNDNSPAP
jgi:circadian clock protein KaiB